MTCEWTSSEIAEAVERVAQEVLWEADVSAPSVDAVAVARRLGCVIAAQRAWDARASRVRLRSGSRRSREVILLDTHDRPERRQWSVAHELGERYAGRVVERLGIEPAGLAGGVREQVANEFASALLLPCRWFKPDAMDCDWDLATLKQIYRTASHELIARRTLALCPTSVCVTVVDNDRQTWRRGNRWGPPPACPAELTAWREANRLGKPVCVYAEQDGLARVRAWPVHEPGWKREIVLTELAEPQ